MQEYRVSLDTYNGPLDLLLYLIRRDEIDIYDIPIASITRQYVEYVGMIRQLDPNLAGEFLVLAATLMEIKTRLLLPPAVSEEGGEAASTSDLDPRAELVRQLLEYKAFKDAAGDLAEAAVLRAQKFARKPFLPQADPTELDMEDIQVWDLLEAFGKILESIGRSPGQHEVIYDDTPVELHAEDILDRLRGEGALSFARIFEGRTNRGEIVGLFIALLELVRQKKVLAAQEETFGDITVQLNPDPPASSNEETADAEAFIAGDQSRVGKAPTGENMQDKPKTDTTDLGDIQGKMNADTLKSAVFKRKNVDGTDTFTTIAYDKTNAVQLDGNELGAASSRKELKQQVKRYAREHFAGTDMDGRHREISMPNGHAAIIPMDGIRHTLGYAKTDDDVYAILALPTLIERAQYHRDGSAGPNRPNVDHEEYYYASLNIGKNRYVAEMVFHVLKGNEKQDKMVIFRSFHHQKIEGLEDQ